MNKRPTELSGALHAIYNSVGNTTRLGSSRQQEYAFANITREHARRCPSRAKGAGVPSQKKLIKTGPPQVFAVCLLRHAPG